MHSFLWLSNNSIVYMYQNFFIHSSVSEHLGWFRVLSIVNSAAMNTGVHASFSILVSSECPVHMPSSEIVGSYSSFIPSFFKESPYCFSIMAVSVYIPTNSERGLPFFHTLSVFSIPSPAFIVCRFFYDGHSDPCMVIPDCSFDLHFSNNEWW